MVREKKSSLSRETISRALAGAVSGCERGTSQQRACCLRGVAIAKENIHRALDEGAYMPPKRESPERVSERARRKEIFRYGPW